MRRISLFPIIILFLLMVALGGSIAYVLTSNGNFSTVLPTPPEAASLSAPLATAQQQTSSIPSWLLVLICSFTIMQILPLLMAASRARKSSLSQRDFRTISFLCETPVYLGLLGSLVGVSMTQFISGSLAAPLAYLTTICGILLYLFAKFTIWLPLYENEPRRVKAQKSRASNA